MRILEVIHGYPPRYNAGSEIYTQTISRALSQLGHEVAVFTREEDPYRPDFNITVETDILNPSIRVYLANHARSRDRYRHNGMDEAFRGVLNIFQPDILHINHLNHLSTGIIDVASDEGLPIVYTLHDYWLACPRGQFLQMALGDEKVYPECPSQENERCAFHCMSRMWGGVNLEEDKAYWTRWVELRMKDVRGICDKISLFISPSLYLKKRITEELVLPEDRIVHEPYGFDHSRLKGRNRVRENEFVFGYIGRIVPAKGVDLLIKAFGATHGKARLRIWGRPTQQDSPALKRIIEDLPNDRLKLIEWLPEYQNEDIVKAVFNRTDAIVVPSIWDENSPLVIQEALQAKVPVITSDKGGMAELIKDGINGWNFHHRSVDDLAKRLQNAIDMPELLDRLSRRGYLLSENGEVHSIEKHAIRLETIFKSLVEAH